MWAIGSIKEDYLGYADGWSYIWLSLLTVISDASKLLKSRVVPDGVGTKKIKAPLKEGYKQLGDSITAASPSITGCSGKSDSNENLSITTLGRRQVR